MRVVTKFINPPIPIRTVDWAAYFEGGKEEICGLGQTEQEALNNLYWQARNSEQERAVAALVDIER